jgi:N-acetylglutamate synthase
LLISAAVPRSTTSMLDPACSRNDIQSELRNTPPVPCSPMSRVRPEEVRLLDELGANAAAATTVQIIDGWWLRAAPDYPFRRCNSALPYSGDHIGLEARIGMVEDFYRQRELPVRFQMSPVALPFGLDDELETRNYEIEEPTLVLTADTGRVTQRTLRDEASAVTVGEGIDEFWAAEFATAFGDDDVGRDRLRAYAHLLRHLGPAVGTAVLPVDETPSAIGLGVLERGWMGVYAMGTRREARRRGAATSVLHALSDWGQTRGAAHTYLQVESTNDAARQLYVRAGFEIAYRYHYRTSA